MVLWRPRCRNMRPGGGTNLSLSSLLMHPLLSKTLYVRPSNGGRGERGREGGKDGGTYRWTDGRMKGSKEGDGSV